MPNKDSSSQLRRFIFSDNEFINSLLSSNLMKWSESNLTYSVPNNFSLEYWSSNYSPTREPNYAKSIQLSYYILAIDQAFQAWENVTNLQFTKIEETLAEVGDFRVAFTSVIDAGYWGWSYYPSSSPRASDIWISSTYENLAPTEWLPGSYNFMGLLHEIGHGLGLKHPFEGNYQLTDEYDVRNYTLMSYTNPSGSYYTDAAGSEVFIAPSVPMVLDILAIQYLYGANLEYRKGNDRYVFDSDKPFFFTIWDAGGVDEINLSNFKYGSKVDLNSGSYSTVYYANNNAINNLGIAYGVNIENVAGTQGQDSIVGNSLDNYISGLAGNDFIDGGPGNDYLIGGLGDDYIDGGTGIDLAIYNDSKESYKIRLENNKVIIRSLKEGLDILESVEFISFKGIRYSANDLIDRAPPSIIRVGPLDEFERFDLTKNLSIYFDEDILLVGGLIEIFDQNGSLLKSISSENMLASENELILPIMDFFRYGRSYSLNFEKLLVQDLTGNQFNNIDSKKVIVRAIEPVELTPPKLLESNIISNSGVSIFNPLEFDFDEIIFWDQGNIEILDEGYSVIQLFDSGSKNHEIYGRRLKLFLDGQFEESHSYKVVISPDAIRDAYGNFFHEVTYDFIVNALPKKILFEKLKFTEDEIWSINLLSFVFDSDYDELSFFIEMDQGDIHLNSTSGIMSGFFGNESVGIDSLDFTVSDGKDSVTINIEYEVENTNDSPIAVSLNNKYEVNDGQLFYISLKDFFIDIDREDKLSFALLLKSKSKIPKWLNVDLKNGYISGSPSDKDVSGKDISFTIRASDEVGDSVDSNFFIDLVDINQRPQITLSGRTVSISEGRDFKIKLPKSLFIDPDKKDVLVYKVIYPNNKDLTWLTVDLKKLIVIGSPNFNVDHTFNLIFMATDSAGQNSDPFELNFEVENITNILGGAKSDQLIGGDGDDVLVGGGGNDFLTGGGGSDKFIFNVRPNPSKNFDVITDFKIGEDLLVFEGDFWGADLMKADLNSYFHFSEETLFFDTDGLGKADPIQIVKLVGLASFDIGSLIFWSGSI